MRYHDPDYKYGRLPYAQRDIGNAAGAGVGVLLVALTGLVLVLCRLAFKAGAWAFKRVF